MNVNTISCLSWGFEMSVAPPRVLDKAHQTKVEGSHGAVMQYPTPQGSTSKTFRPPPLDGTLALHALPEFHAKNSPNHPAFRFEEPKDGSIKTLRWVEVFLAIQTARQILQGGFGLRTSGSHPVVALLVSTGRYIFTLGIPSTHRQPHRHDVILCHLSRSDASRIRTVPSVRAELCCCSATCSEGNSLHPYDCQPRSAPPDNSRHGMS